MLKVYFIRHGETYGNTLKRYIGVTDESIRAESVKVIQNKRYPRVDFIYMSPLKRCCETAAIIYPEQPLSKLDDLKECDFGDFENKNYQELADNDDYQKWIDSNATLPFPNGEDMKIFRKRCEDIFIGIINQSLAKDFKQIAIVTHGGVIMAIMERFNQIKQEFYEWLPNNGEGYEVQIDKNNWLKELKVSGTSKLKYE